MDRTGVLLLILAGAGVAMLAQTASASNDGAPAFLPTPSQDSVDNAVNNVAAQNTPDQRIAAFLAMIRQFESHNDYSIIYGGGHFSDFSDHPRIKIWFHDPTKSAPGDNNYTTAAGAYQIISTTFDQFARKLGITDFTPASQDAIAVALLKYRGAHDAIVAGDIAGALALASREWASLPGSTAQQNPKTLSTAMNAFDQWLASVTTST